MRETILIGTMNIGLPTADVITDGTFMYELYRGPHHPNCDFSLNMTTYQACLEKEQQLLYDVTLASITFLQAPDQYQIEEKNTIPTQKMAHFNSLVCLVNYIYL